MDRARKQPATFADSGIALLFQTAYTRGVDKKRCIVRLVGGAEVAGLQGIGALNVGKRNILIARQILWQNGVMVAGESTGGTIPRTVNLGRRTGSSRFGPDARWWPSCEHALLDQTRAAGGHRPRHHRFRAAAGDGAPPDGAAARRRRIADQHRGAAGERPGAGRRPPAARQLGPLHGVAGADRARGGDAGRHGVGARHGDPGAPAQPDHRRPDLRPRRERSAGRTAPRRSWRPAPSATSGRC